MHGTSGTCLLAPAASRAHPEHWCSLNTLAKVRDAYIRRYRSRSRKEAAHFAAGSLRERIRKAANAISFGGSKHKHQWRIKGSTLSRFSNRLEKLLPSIRKARSFPALLTLVELARIKGIGRLTVYDTTTRIGAGQKVKPDKVYLHAGTRVGAKRLNWDFRRDSLRRSELPRELARLSASEIEDMLCIYADCFGSRAKNLDPKGCVSGPRGCGQGRARLRGC